MAREIKDIKKDRLRYTKNTISANLMYIGIVFNIFYFVSIYQADVNDYYYNIEIGISILCNLVFLLIAFLSSEGLKNYKISYAYTVIVLGALQFVRMLGIPQEAHNTTAMVKGQEVLVMDDSQYMYVLIALTVSGIACIVAGLIGVYKTTTLQKYLKENGLTN